MASVLKCCLSAHVLKTKGNSFQSCPERRRFRVGCVLGRSALACACRPSAAAGLCLSVRLFEVNELLKGLVERG